MSDEIILTAKARRARRRGDEYGFPCFFALFGWLGLFCISPFAALAGDAPATPFYYAGATPLDRQIVTLVIGVNDSIGQALVSENRRHVPLNVDASLMGDAGIRGFNYQKSGLGFVGSGEKAVERGGLTPSIAASAGQIASAASPLDKPGMVLIAPLER